MKFGLRKPSIKKSIKSRTTGRLKREIKRAINPFYSKKGMGWIRKKPCTIKFIIKQRSVYLIY